MSSLGSDEEKMIAAIVAENADAMLVAMDVCDTNDLEGFLHYLECHVPELRDRFLHIFTAGAVSGPTDHRSTQELVLLYRAMSQWLLGLVPRKACGGTSLPHSRGYRSLMDMHRAIADGLPEEQRCLVDEYIRERFIALPVDETEVTKDASFAEDTETEPVQFHKSDRETRFVVASECFAFIPQELAAAADDPQEEIIATAREFRRLLRVNSRPLVVNMSWSRSRGEVRGRYIDRVMIVVRGDETRELAGQSLLVRMRVDDASDETTLGAPPTVSSKHLLVVDHINERAAPPVVDLILCDHHQGS